MFSFSRAQRLCLSVAAGLAVVLMASPAVHADEAALAVLPAPAPSWDTTSGYGAVEANRATTPLDPALPVITSMVSRDVRWAPASEPSLAAVMAAANAWDSTSGYAAVESNRAAAPAALAPDSLWDETSGYGAVEANRAESAAALAPSWDVTSGYGAVEAIRAAR
jgi:hypothetical protein